MELLSVSQAASLLDVHSSRVRQLLFDGGLRGQHIGNRWLVDGDSVRDRKQRVHSPGRPLSARNAWGAIALLGGYSPVWLSAPESSRLRARLRDLALHSQPADWHLQRLLAARADVHRYRAHPGVLPAIVKDPEVVIGGVSAAAIVGADYVAPNKAEVYVRHSKAANDLEAKFGMIIDQARGNLLVRVPPEQGWAFLAMASSSDDQRRYAPAPVVAADLLDIQEDRAQAAAAGLLGPLLSAYAAKASNLG